MTNVIPITTAPSFGGAVLSFHDEEDLRTYFALELPPPPGTRSTFGPMCERVANSRNPKTKELPSDGVPWTEILDCRLRQATNNMSDAEDAYIAYVDARRRVSRVHSVLSRLSESEEAVLRAFYTRDADAVAPLTPTGERTNRECAVRGQHETVDASVERLHREAKNMRASKTSRDDARATLGAIRREATEMLQEARVSYARFRGAKR